MGVSSVFFFKFISSNFTCFSIIQVAPVQSFQASCKFSRVVSFLRKMADQYKNLAENERLARQIAETNVSEFDKEKTMLKEEVKQLVARHEKV